MKISEIFNLNKSQYELDFVDIDLDRDTPLFLDPYYISKSDFPFARRAYSSLKNFFEYLLSLLRQNRIQEARELFSYLTETNEICLGMSKGKPSGKGMGPEDANKIFESLLKSKAYKTGLMSDIEDFRIFVPNVDKDKISDMTANIIKLHLIIYTQNQCKIWDIPLSKGVPSGNYWNDRTSQWDNKYTDMLVYNGRKIILVPKRIVSFSKAYTSEQYKQHFVLNFLQNEHLKLQTNLVQTRKDGSKYVTKKSIEKDIGSIDKEWLNLFTIRHPDVFQDFKRNIINKEEVIKNEEITTVSIESVIHYLIKKLKIIPSGTKYANKYHKLVLGILELLFYPNLANPKVENNIHDSRKRIDITFDNCSEEGFFFRLSTIHSIPSSLIVIECKNYSNDVKNPEIDQLSGRFSVNRGKVGILTCRNILDKKTLIKRCQDTYKDNRGLIIPMTDEDLIKLLEYKLHDESKIDVFLQQKLHEIIVD